jgi:SAM-dependent methyltransferase
MDKQTQQELNDSVERYFTEEAPAFSETRSRVTSSWEPLKRIANAVPAGANVLDVGCGNGRLLELLSGRFVRYLGVDPSDAMLLAAREKYPEQRFLTGDIIHLGELADRNFDFVFAVAVLHHLPGYEPRIAALKQLKNKVAQSGKIVVTVWNFWGDRKRQRLVWRFAALKLIGKNRMDWGDVYLDRKDASVRRYYHAFSTRGLKRLAKAAGLRVERIERDRFNYYLTLTQ